MSVVVVVVDVLVVVPPARLPSEQSASAAASAPRPTNFPATSFRIVAPAKRAQFRSVPVTTRIPDRTCGAASGRPTAFATTLRTRPCFRRTTRTGERPAGASGFRKRKRGTVPIDTVQPTSPTTRGTESVALPSLAEKRSTSAPPGLPTAGSSAPPSDGKSASASRETKTSVSAVALRLSTSFTPSIGWSSACADAVRRSDASTTATAVGPIGRPPFARSRGSYASCSPGGQGDSRPRPGRATDPGYVSAA